MILTSYLGIGCLIGVFATLKTISMSYITIITTIKINCATSWNKKVAKRSRSSGIWLSSFSALLVV